MNCLCRKIPDKTKILELFGKGFRLGFLPWPAKSGGEIINIWQRIWKGWRVCRDRESEENKVIDPIFWGAETFWSKDRRLGVSNPTKYTTGTSSCWGIRVSTRSYLLSVSFLLFTFIYILLHNYVPYTDTLLHIESQLLHKVETLFICFSCDISNSSAERGIMIDIK